jgi:transcriptional regulator with XRE-family HTH domain
MEKSTFTPLYELFRMKLVALRKNAKLNQRQLAERLGRDHSFVGRIELGERRLDLVEFFWVCRACGADPVKVAAEIMQEFGAFAGKPSLSRRKRVRA